jgi:hypothetical protein
MNDEKTAADYKVQGGSVLHLVLALRCCHILFFVVKNWPRTTGTVPVFSYEKTVSDDKLQGRSVLHLVLHSAQVPHTFFVVAKTWPRKQFI